ncbi:hypothetical protein N7478_009028 [Penicillium angulare]|uniref:uncharacterized protein n=1 Tax=Penicillium angulare TaxID=116970 RepID=UPI0025416A46|nr:uncharacterized protein N7478_009028 [Penicillium angulare]KAJ5273903.1 hypothetical protein N7478_009028 [Penicillium angulare]
MDTFPYLVKPILHARTRQVLRCFCSKSFSKQGSQIHVGLAPALTTQGYGRYVTCAQYKLNDIDLNQNHGTD